MTLFLVLIAAIAIGLLAVCDWPDADDEPMEFKATFDALQAEKDEAAKSRARLRDHEVAVRAAARMIDQARNGPLRDGHEV